ncbi:hypothetical protein CYY_000774 [Polysphondylium violaceum]|uniref:Integral membrane bound transporter domain-containing protein n=1 Tax=Polysphondylium violaceum TaxID=133409 RepID=A0A8J4UWU6_9MYCE|nr:hypothetical protein CYY_000774 [Polysphondylium violaceum]
MVKRKKNNLNNNQLFKLVKFIYKAIFTRQSRERYHVILFYSLLVATAISLSLLGEIFTFTREFFEYTHILIYITMFTSTIISSSDSYNIIMRTGVQMVVATVIGDVAAYITLVICHNHLWTGVFMYLVFILLTCGPMLSSQNLLPFTIGKRMYLEFFLLIFFIRPKTLSPIIFLKSSLGSLCSCLAAIVACLLFNPPFSSDLYVKNCAVIMHRSHQCLKRIGRVLEAKTLHSMVVVQQQQEQESQMNDEIILSDIKKRLSQSLTNLPIFIEEKSSKLIFNREIFNIDTNSDSSDTIEDDYITYSPRSGHGNSYDTSCPIYNNENDYCKNNDDDENQEEEIIPIEINDIEKDLNLEDGDFENKRLNNILFNYKKSFKKSKDNYSLILNNLYKYQKESNGEFWKQKTVSYFKEITGFLEKNFNLIVVLANSIDKELSNSKFAFLVKIIPSLNELILLSNNIFIIMENQLSGNYFNFKSWVHNEIPPALEYSQLKIFNYFDRLETVIEQIRKQFQTIDSTFLGKNHLCGFHFLLTTITKFSRDQKILSSLIYSLCCEIYLHKIFYHPQVIFHIFIYFRNSKQFNSNNNNSNNNNQYPIELEPKFNFQEKCIYLMKYLSYRLFYRWIFTVKFAIALSILSIGFFETTKHSNFILFRNMSWFIITFIFIMTPSAGGSIFYCFMRFFGTILGVWLAYTGGVLFSLPKSSVAQAFIFVGWSFVIFFCIYFFCKSKPFNNFINFFTLSYATISFPEYSISEPLVINSLLRAFHIIIGVSIVLGVTLILPHYDFIDLETNLLNISKKTSATLKKLYGFYLETNWGYDINNQKDNLIQTPPLECNNMVNLCTTKRKCLSRCFFKKITIETFVQLRSDISQQRILLFKSRFELFFNRKRFNQLKILLEHLSNLYTILICCEFIFDSRFIGSNQFKYEIKGKLLNQITTIINQIESSSEMIQKLIESKNGKLQEPLLYRQCNKEHIKDLFKEYNTLLKKYEPNEPYLTFQMGSLIYTLEFFVIKYDKVLELIFQLSNSIKTSKNINDLFIRQSLTTPSTVATPIETGQPKQ